MTTHPGRGFLDALDALRRALDEPGVPRLTVDIDATIAAPTLNIERLVEALGRHGIQPRIPDAVAFAHARQVLLCSP